MEAFPRTYGFTSFATKSSPLCENPRLERQGIGGVPLQAMGYSTVHQEGSHIVLQTPDPFPHRMPANRSRSEPLAG